MAGKSILEQALLQVETLEEAVKANAKGILASTMKQELNSLLKEQEDEDPEEEEQDVEDTTMSDDDDTSISDDDDTSISDDDDDDISTEDEDLPDDDEEEVPALVNKFGGDEESSDDTLDMTNASDSEVLKVFKAMKPEDGIVVKKDGNTVQFSDDGNDYIIKLDGDDDSNELPDEDDDDFSNGLSEQNGSNETVYEIELDGEDDDDSQMYEPKEEKMFDGNRGIKKPVVKEPKEGVSLPTKSPNKSGPFKQSSPQNGVKKLQANEQAGLNHPGTSVKGVSGAQTKEPGKGQNKTSDGRPGTGVKGTDSPKKFDNLGKGNSTTSTRPGTPLKGTGKPVVKEPKEGQCKECGNNPKMETDEAARTKWNIHGDKGGSDRAGLKSKKIFKAGAGNVNEEVEILRKQNYEYKKALILFKDKLNEVAVFNANLAYATRLFTEHSTTKQEKLNILKRFDSISTINESKNLYSAIRTELDTKRPISESAAEKIASTKTSSSSGVLSESKAYENPQFKRMKDLMSKIK